MRPNAVCGQNRGAFARKDIGLDAAVVGDGHGRRFAVLVQVIGKALRRLAHGIDVHAVGAGADHAAQPAGSEFQIPVKPVVYFIGLILNTFQLFG